MAHFDPPTSCHASPWKPWKIQPTATGPAGPSVTPVIVVSTAGWHGAQPAIGLPFASVWAVSNPNGCSMFAGETRSQAFGSGWIEAGGLDPAELSDGGTEGGTDGRPEPQAPRTRTRRPIETRARRVRI